MVDLLTRLKNEGIDAELCVFDGTDTPFKEVFKSTCIPLIEFSKGRNVYSPVNLLSLIKLLFNHEDYKDLANKIKSLINDSDLYENISKRCIARALEYDISKMAAAYKKEYMNLINRK